jgi:hypothetical protein
MIQPIQAKNRSGKPQRSVRKTKVKEGESNQYDSTTCLKYSEKPTNLRRG